MVPYTNLKGVKSPDQSESASGELTPKMKIVQELNKTIYPFIEDGI